MEYDRYAANKKLFIIAMICLVASLSLFIFSAYIIPFLFLEWAYDVPEFLLHWLDWLENDLRVSPAFADWMVFLYFLIPAIATGMVSYLISNKIDNQIYGIETKNEEKLDENITTQRKPGEKSGTILSLKLIAIILLVFIIGSFIEFLLYIESP